MVKCPIKKEYSKMTMERAIDLVIVGKSAEGLRERTSRDYRNDWKYLVKWLLNNYEIEFVDELSLQVFRDYINYLKYDAPKYDGHKFIKSEQGIGLSDTTINIRLRVYSAMFNYLEREDLIEINPMTNVRLLKLDIDLTNCFTDNESLFP